MDFEEFEQNAKNDLQKFQHELIKLFYEYGFDLDSYDGYYYSNWSQPFYQPGIESLEKWKETFEYIDNLPLKED